MFPKWKTTSIVSHMEDDLKIFPDERRPKNFQNWNTTSNFSKFEEDLKFSNMKEDLSEHLSYESA